MEVRRLDSRQSVIDIQLAAVMNLVLDHQRRLERHAVAGGRIGRAQRGLAGFE